MTGQCYHCAADDGACVSEACTCCGTIVRETNQKATELMDAMRVSLAPVLARQHAEVACTLAR